MYSNSRCMQEIRLFRAGKYSSGHNACMLARGERFLESAAIEQRQSAIRHRRLLAVLTLCVCTAAAGAPAESPDAAQAKAKLAAVRQRIAELTGRLGAELKQRDALSARLRDADLAITAERRRLESLTAAEAALERQRNELNAEEARNRAALEAERASLAAQVRAQYMIGRADEMRLLLSQTNPAEAGRMVTYYGYFARLRAARIEEIDARETRVAQLTADVERTSANLKSMQEEASREVAGLMRAREERTRRHPGAQRAGAERQRAARALEAGGASGRDAGRRSRASAQGFSGGLGAELRRAAWQAALARERQDDRALSGDARPRRSQRGAAERRDDRDRARRQGAARLAPDASCTPTGCRAWDCS